MSTYQKLHDAITKKQVVEGEYDGHDRKFCPHELGRKNGREMVFVYQFSGTTSSGPIKDPTSKDNWKCLQVSKLTITDVYEGEWRTASNHSEPNKCIDETDVVVEHS